MSSAAPIPPAETGPAPVTDFVIANRAPVGWVLVAVGVVALVAGIALLARGFRTIEGPPAAAAAPGEPPADPVRVAHPHRTEYLIGGIAALWLVVDSIGCGAFLLSQLAKPTTAARRTNARILIIVWAGLIGIDFMLAGFALFIVWSKSVTDGVGGGKIAELVWVAGPVLGVLAGAGLALVACLPARAEERNNVTLRRVIYGANVGLTGVLLVCLLVIGNVFAAVRVPNKLDTTESGFYSLELSETTRQYLAKIDQPVRLYTTIPETAAGEEGLYCKDTHRLLNAVAAANPAKIQVQFLSTTVNAAKISQLKGKYPQADLNDFGILVTAGEDEKRNGFVRFEELFERTPQGTQFKGESRIVRELLFLAEGDAKPVVYFTQTAGELPLTGGGRRSAAELSKALEKNNCVVKTLSTADLTDPAKLVGGKPKIPDDAAIVVVADPTTPVPAGVAAALSAYMDAPRPNGKKGKLVVLSSPRAKVGGGLESTGLDEVLNKFNVRLGTKFLYNAPLRTGFGFDIAIVGVPEAFATADNPIGIAYAGKTLPMTNCRLVESGPADRTSAFQAKDLFLTAADRPTWLEDETLPDPSEVFEELSAPTIRPGETRDQAVRRVTAFRGAKSYAGASRPVAATVSEGETTRAVVFGSGDFFADETSRMFRGQPVQAEMFATTIDWLRDRPAVAAVANKTYGVYTPNPKPDTVRLLLLPGGLAVLFIVALGAGVWTLRRT